MDLEPQQSGRLSIASAIQSQVDRLGSYSRLEDEILRQNGNLLERRVDRRKLKRIAEGDPKLTLNIQELLALDAYLTQFGEGLSDKPLFQSSKLLEPFAEDGDVTFLLGVRPETGEEGGRNALSQWDVNAMTTLIKGLYYLSPTVHFDFLDAIFSRKAPEPDESWVAFLEEDRRTAISLGSPRASKASEYMLSRMFGQKPDEKTSQFTPPFQFFWPGEQSSSSGFVTGSRTDPAPGSLRLENEELASSSTDSFAIVAAQRRPRGHLWLVLAGLTGPMTYAAALAAKNLVRHSLPPKPGGPLEVHWSIVQSSIHIDAGVQGDPRRVIENQRVMGPRIWQGKP